MELVGRKRGGKEKDIPSSVNRKGEGELESVQNVGGTLRQSKGTVMET